MEVFVDRVPERAADKHQVNKRRHDGQQYLENQNVGQGDPPQHALPRKDVAMFPDRLQNPKRPAETLAHQAIGVGRGFGEGQCQVFVFHAMPVFQQRHGEVGIFRHGIHVIATRLAHGLHAPRSDRSWHHAHRAHRVERPPLEVLAGDVLQRLPARPQVHAIPHFGVACDRRHLRIQEVGHHPCDGVRSDDGVGVDANEEFRIVDVLEPEVQCLSLTAIGLGENDDLARRLFPPKRGARNFQGAVLRTIVNHNHPQVGVVGVERALDRAFDNLLLVVSGNEDSNLGFVCRNLFRRPVHVRAKAVVNCENSDRNQAPGHEHVAQEKDDRNGHDHHREQPEAEGVQPGRPKLIRGQRRHHFSLGAAEQLVHRDKFETASAGALNNQGQRLHRLGPVSAAIMQKNDVAATLVVQIARRKMGQHIGGNLLGRALRLVAPVVGIDFVADRDVTHFLREFERPHFVFRIRLLIDRVGRPEKNGANPQTAGKELLGQIQLHPHEAGRNIADIGMRERVIPDFVPFPVHPAGDAAELVCLNSDQKKRGGHMLPLQDIQNFRRPLRIRTVVKRQREFLLARPIASHPVGFGQRRESLVADQPGRFVNRKIAFPIRRPRLDPQDLAVAFHVHVLPGGNIAQFVGRVGVARDIPHPP